MKEKRSWLPVAIWYVMIAVAVLIFAVVLVQPASAMYVINNNATGGNCTTIGLWTAGNLTCKLTSNLNSPNNISIQSNTIIFDGNGYTISNNTYTGNGVIVSGLSNVVIKNIKINGFSIGIRVDTTSNNITLDNITSINNSIGVQLSGSDTNSLINNSNISYNQYGTKYGVYISSGSRHRVLNSTIIYNGDTGIVLNGDNHTINNSYINNNQVIGIYSNSGTNNTIFNTSILNNTAVGIRFLSTSQGNILQDNNISNNPIGIDLNNSHNHTIINNTEMDSSSYSSRISHSYNISLSYNRIFNSFNFITDGSNNIIELNDTYNNCKIYCIYTLNSTNISITNITINNFVDINTTTYAMVVSNVSNLNISNSNFNGNFTYGIYNAGQANAYNTNLFIYNNNATNITATHFILTRYTNNSFIYNNFVSVISKNSNFNVSNIDTDDANNISIYNNTLTSAIIKGGISDTDLGIEISDCASNTSIYNNTISGWYVGIGTNYDGFGHCGINSDNTLIYNNTINNTGYGIFLNFTESPIISNNIFGSNVTAPIKIQLSSINAVLQNQTTFKMASPNTVIAVFGGQSNIFNTGGTGILTLNITTWNTAGDYHKTILASSDVHDNPTQFTIGDFPANTLIQVRRNGAAWNQYGSNSTGYISFTYDGWSDQQFGFSVAEENQKLWGAWQAPMNQVPNQWASWSSIMALAILIAIVAIVMLVLTTQIDNIDFFQMISMAAITITVLIVIFGIVPGIGYAINSIFSGYNP